MHRSMWSLLVLVLVLLKGDLRATETRTKGRGTELRGAGTKRRL